MIKIFKPLEMPTLSADKLAVFLAGSIEMGVAENWQLKVERALQDHNVILLNPRRDDWDTSWEQKIENVQFNEQVTWELNCLEYSDHIIMYFDPKTMSPISLLEFGLFARSGKLLVVCPDGFWRKGNVDIVCKKYKVSQFKNLDDVISFLKFKSNNF